MLPLKPLPPLPQETAEAAIPTAMQAEWILFGTCSFHHLMRLVEPKSMVKSLHPNEMEEGKEIYISTVGGRGSSGLEFAKHKKGVNVQKERQMPSIAHNTTSYTEVKIQTKY